MRVATDHILGKFESEIWVQTFGRSIAPSLMPHAASIKVNAQLLPPLVPRTLSRPSHTPVFRRFNNFELKLRPHGRFSKEMHSCFDIAGSLSA